MNRDEWEFEYTAAKLAEGALERRNFRGSRVTWWREQKETVMALVKESGIEVEESVGAKFSSSSYGNQPRVVVRGDLQRKLTECHDKIEEHERAVKEYDGWVQVLNANPESRLKLTQDDWLYFFGK